MSELDRRVARLEARAEIENLMQLYARAADLKYSAAKAKKPQVAIDHAAALQAGCFAPDAVWAGGRFGGDLTGRDAIEAFFRKSPWHFTAHHYGSAFIEIGEGRASAAWRLLEIGIREACGTLVLMSGDVAQELLLTEEGWKIVRMSFSRLHSFKLSDDPGTLDTLIP